MFFIFRRTRIGAVWVCNSVGFGNERQADAKILSIERAFPYDEVFKKFIDFETAKILS